MDIRPERPQDWRKVENLTREAFWNGRFWRWSAAQSYGAYVFHMLLMLVLQNLTDGLWMGAFGKFLFIGVVSTILSFVFTWLARMIPGVKSVL